MSSAPAGRGGCPVAHHGGGGGGGVAAAAAAAAGGGSTHRVRGKGCTRGPHSGDTWGRGRCAPFPGPSPRSPWGAASTDAPGRTDGRTDRRGRIRVEMGGWVTRLLLSLLSCM